MGLFLKELLSTQDLYRVNKNYKFLKYWNTIADLRKRNPDKIYFASKKGEVQDYSVATNRVYVTYGVLKVLSATHSVSLELMAAHKVFVKPDVSSSCEAKKIVAAKIKPPKAKMSYRAQLTTPEWAAFRKRVLKRDRSTCRQCGATKHLHVHHKKYVAGKRAWEYPLKNCITLCRECHCKAHDIDPTLP